MNISRKDALTSLIVLPALAGAMIGRVRASDDDSKKQFEYQDKPNGAQQCSKCSLFVPAKNANASGTCRIVKGAISPNGWCKAFSSKD